MLKVAMNHQISNNDDHKLLSELVDYITYNHRMCERFQESDPSNLLNGFKDYSAFHQRVCERWEKTSTSERTELLDELLSIIEDDTHNETPNKVQETQSSSPNNVSPSTLLQDSKLSSAITEHTP